MKVEIPWATVKKLLTLSELQAVNLLRAEVYNRVIDLAICKKLVDSVHAGEFELFSSMHRTQGGETAAVLKIEVPRLYLYGDAFFRVGGLSDQQANLIRHLCQHHLSLQDERVRIFFQVELAFEPEEIEAWDLFCGAVASHLLERLVESEIETAVEREDTHAT